MASAHFHLRVLAQAQSVWGSIEDGDYPEILHISRAYPGMTKKGLVDPALALPAVIRALRTLENAGCTHVAIPCNSLHVLLPELQKHTHLFVFDMVDATANAVARAFQTRRRPVVVLGSDSTAASHLYDERLVEKGIRTAVVPAVLQEQITELIHAVMKTGPTAQLEAMLTKLMLENFATDTLFVLGCTELSLLTPAVPNGTVIDSLSELVTRLFETDTHENLQRAA